MQTGQRDAAFDRKRAQIHHGNGGGSDGASRIVGDDRSTVGVFLEVVLSSDPASLVGDVGGAAVARDHDAVRDVIDADLRNLRRGGRGQVDLGQRIVRVQHGVGGLAAGDGGAARGSRRAVGKTGDEGEVHRKLDLSLVGQQAVRPDAGDGNVAAVLAEQQVVAVLRIDEAGGAALCTVVRVKLLQ